MAISYSDPNTWYSSATTTYIGEIWVVSLADNLAFTENDTYNSIASYIDTLTPNDNIQAIKTIFVQVEDGLSLQDEDSYTIISNLKEQLGLTEELNTRFIIVLVDQMSLQEDLTPIEILKFKELLGLSDDVSIFSWWEELVDWMDRNDLDTDWIDKNDLDTDWTDRDE